MAFSPREDGMTAEVLGAIGVNSLVLLVVVAPLILAVYCTVDVVKQPALTSGRKALWIVGFYVGWLAFAVLALVLEIVYLAVVRPKLRGSGA
jgi:hypothetical protein